MIWGMPLLLFCDKCCATEPWNEISSIDFFFSIVYCDLKRHVYECTSFIVLICFFSSAKVFVFFPRKPFFQAWRCQNIHDLSNWKYSHDRNFLKSEQSQLNMMISHSIIGSMWNIENSWTTHLNDHIMIEQLGKTEQARDLFLLYVE